MSKQFRQGDVFIEEVERIPPGAKKIPGPIILAHGEVTNHAHRVVNRLAKYFGVGEERYLETPTRSQVLHEEHDTITLEPGIYRIVRQREYNPKEVRYVAD